MAKAKKRVAARKKSSKRGKASAKPARKKVAKRAAPKKSKSKVRRAKKMSAPKSAARKVPTQVLEAPIETTTIDLVEKPVPGVVVVTEYEPVRTATPISPDGESGNSQGTSPGAIEPRAA